MLGSRSARTLAGRHHDSRGSQAPAPARHCRRHGDRTAGTTRRRHPCPLERRRENSIQGRQPRHGRPSPHPTPCARRHPNPGCPAAGSSSRGRVGGTRLADPPRQAMDCDPGRIHAARARDPNSMSGEHRRSGIPGRWVCAGQSGGSTARHHSGRYSRLGPPGRPRLRPEPQRSKVLDQTVRRRREAGCRDCRHLRDGARARCRPALRHTHRRGLGAGPARRVRGLPCPQRPRPVGVVALIPATTFRTRAYPVALRRKDRRIMATSRTMAGAAGPTSHL
jgi:hypothetical protein